MTATQDMIRIRTARANEIDDIRDLTLAAYAEFATSMPAVNWRGLRATILKTLSQPGNAEVIIAELGSELVGSVPALDFDVGGGEGVKAYCLDLTID